MVPQPVTQTAQQKCLGEGSLRVATSVTAWQPHVPQEDGRVAGRAVGRCWQGQGGCGFKKKISDASWLSKSLVNYLLLALLSLHSQELSPQNWAICSPPVCNSDHTQEKRVSFQQKMILPLKTNGKGNGEGGMNEDWNLKRRLHKKVAISETGSIPTKCIINFLVIGVKIISPSVSTLLNNIYIYIYICLKAIFKCKRLG